MKPDWKDAPKWANWLSMHVSGEHQWHSHRPPIQWKAQNGVWQAMAQYRIDSTGRTYYEIDPLYVSLEERPK